MREEALRGLLLLLAGITLAVLWSSGTLAFACGLITMTFLNRAVSSSHFGRETLLEPKTGLFNASYFQEVAELELQRCRRLDRPASVLMADLDHLREINNKYGHQTGDVVIRRVAEVIKSGTRLFDVPSRFGGEEFAVLLPETSKRRARVIAERLRQMLAEEEFRASRMALSGAGEVFHVTMSVGVATFPEDATKADILMARADQAAYAAKAGGRNQVKVFNPPPDLELLLAKDH
jgi:diguanylate cyclase (GGDEF)-like protein